MKSIRQAFLTANTFFKTNFGSLVNWLYWLSNSSRSLRKYMPSINILSIPEEDVQRLFHQESSINKFPIFTTWRCNEVTSLHVAFLDLEKQKKSLVKSHFFISTMFKIHAFKCSFYFFFLAGFGFLNTFSLLVKFISLKKR